MKTYSLNENIPVFRRLSFRMLLSFALPILIVFGIYLCAMAAVQQKEHCMQTQSLYQDKCEVFLNSMSTEVYRMDALLGILYQDPDAVSAVLKGYSAVGYYEARMQLLRSIRAVLNLTPQPDNMALHNIGGSPIIVCSSDGSFYRGGTPWPDGMFDEEKRYYLHVGPIPELSVKNYALAVYRPVRDPISKQIKAISVVYENVNMLESQFKALPLYEEDYMFMAAEDGSILFSSGNGKREYTECGKKYGMELVKMDGRKYLHFVSQSTIWGWRVEVLSPLPGFFRGMTLAMGVNLITIFLLVLISVIITSLLSQWIYRPLISLTQKMMQAGEDGFIKAEGYRHKDEVLVITNTYNRMVNNIQMLIHEKYELRNLKLQTELDALQSRINPHFLFNTLNGIKSMCILQDEEEIGQMVQTLADILRFSLDTGTRLIPFGEELTQVQKYFYLQSKRFGSRFQVTYDISPDVEKLMVPCITLQPIAENIFKHAISGKGVCMIRVSASSQAGRFHIEMANTGRIPTQETLDRINRMLCAENGIFTEHIGLMNLYRRLFLYFGKHIHICLYSENGWTVTHVDIPATDKPTDRVVEDI